MLAVLEVNLRELSGLEKNAFAFGEKTAYVECLEMIQSWEYAHGAGLNYDIEKRFPI